MLTHPPSPLHAPLAKLRALATTDTPNERAWYGICQVLVNLSEEGRAIALEYLEGHLTRWPEPWNTLTPGVTLSAWLERRVTLALERSRDCRTLKLWLDGLFEAALARLPWVVGLSTELEIDQTEQDWTNPGIAPVPVFYPERLYITLPGAKSPRGETFYTFRSTNRWVLLPPDGIDLEQAPPSLEASVLWSWVDDALAQMSDG